MNGNLSIELAHQHQQELFEYASQSRLAARPSRTVQRPTLATRRRRWRDRSRDVPRYDSVGGAGPVSTCNAV